MNKALWLIALAALSVRAAVAVASDTSDVMAVVHQLVGGFKYDRSSALAVCADEASIIDSIAPMEWHGRGACAKWFDAYDEEVKTGGITNPVLTLGNPKHLDFSGDTAYLVAAMTYTYEQGGKLKKQTGGTVTMSLKKGQSGWRITGMAWTDGIESVKPM